MKKDNLLSLDEVLPRSSRFDSVSSRKKEMQPKHNPWLLSRCNRAWEHLRPFREVRERVKQYCYDDQWGDVITYDNGTMTEREYIRMKGNIPLSNNIMVSILNSIVGLYAKQGTEPQCFARTRDAQWLSDMMSATMQSNWQETHMRDLLKHVVEEFLVSGVALVRESYEERLEIFDSWTDMCNPVYAFWEGGSDPRHEDLTLIGMLHDVSAEDLYFKFAKSEYGLTISDLNEIYGINSQYPADPMTDSNETNRLENVSFDHPSTKGYYRVIEVWSKEVKPRYQCWDPIATTEGDSYYRIEKSDLPSIREENKKRKALYDMTGVSDENRAYIKCREIVDVYWYYTFLAPDGRVLCEGETPYDHKSHPFTLKCFPYTNGEIHPYMSFIIDQQRYINRLIVMNDFAIRTAAKGITIVPEDAIPDHMTPADFADQFTSYDGLVFYNSSKFNPAARPEVITSGGVNLGTNELLQTELSLIRDISNVSGALQGRTPTAGTSASRYALETQNATTSLFTIISDITEFTEKLASKKCSVIKQFYEAGRMIFNKDNTGVYAYDALSARDVKFKIAIKESAATATYQTMINDQLKELLQMGAINLEQYLSNTTLPFADKLLQEYKEQQRVLMEQQAEMEQQQQMTKNRQDGSR